MPPREKRPPGPAALAPAGLATVDPAPGCHVAPGVCPAVDDNKTAAQLPERRGHDDARMIAPLLSPRSLTKKTRGIDTVPERD